MRDKEREREKERENRPRTWTKDDRELLHWHIFLKTLWVCIQDPTYLFHWSIWNCARNWNSIIWTNSKPTTHNLSWITIRTNGSPNLGQATKPRINQQKRELAVPDDHREKSTENENKDKYLDLIRELKKNMDHESDSGTIYNWCSW